MSEIVAANVFFSSDKQTGIIGGTPNTFSIIAGNTTSLIANSSGVTLNSVSFSSNSSITVGNSSVNTFINTTSISIGTLSVNSSGTIANTFQFGTSVYFHSNGNIGIGNTSSVQKLTVAGNIVPSASNTHDLGTTTLRWRNIYTNDLNLNNGIGDYTIVEGEDDLFIYNNKKNKVYKFMLIEVDSNTAPPKAS